MKAMYDVLDDDTVNKILEEFNFGQIEVEVYPSKEEILEIAEKVEGYLGTAEVSCNNGLWSYSIIKDYGISEYYNPD